VKTTTLHYKKVLVVFNYLGDLRSTDGKTNARAKWWN